MNNNQEICDFVISKMCEQNAQSVNNTGTCMYRNSTGKKCAVGHLILDEFYSPNLEFCNLGDGDKNVETAVINSCTKLGWSYDESTRIMLRMMQISHDCYDSLVHDPENLQFKDYFKNAVRKKFIDYKLPITVKQ